MQDGDRDSPSMLVGPARLVEERLEEVVGLETLDLTQHLLPDLTLQRLVSDNIPFCHFRL